MRKFLISSSCVAFALGGFSVAVASGDQNVQALAWQPSAGHMQVPIWPDAVPDAQFSAKPGTEIMKIDPADFIAGKTIQEVDNVSQPTMTVYSPEEKNTGTAIVVFPGGGYHDLAIDLEGTEVCDWLTPKGITCVLLKYRVPFSGPHWDEKCNCHIEPKAPMALEDAQRTMGLLRLHAAEFHIDPHKIGVIGFSAGGHLVASISTHFEARAYAAIDAADNESCRPDFAIALYPGHLSLAKNTISLNPDIDSHITPQTPPTFLLQNEDDDVDRVEDALSYYMALKKAGVPVELHSYARGGHAFGLRRTKFPVSRWPQLVETWMMSLEMISE
ncbi:MAG: alpha/beta hydrolase [Aliidongia sp.]